MILKIKMGSSTNEKITLPIHYNHIVQGLIYECLNKELSQFLHEKGFRHHERSFKMFTFSRLMGRFNIDKEKGQITFDTPIDLVIASLVEGFFNSLASMFLVGNTIRLGNNNLEVMSIEGNHINLKGNEVIVQTLSPIVVYSTFLRPDNRKYTCYFQPGDPDYDRLITENLKKKYVSFFNIEAPKGIVEVKNLTPCKRAIINYKNIVIKGYSAKLKLVGPKELLKVGLEAGIGSKNSQGFGMIKLVK